MELVVAGVLPPTGAVTWTDEALDSLTVECEPGDEAELQVAIETIRDWLFVAGIAAATTGDGRGMASISNAVALRPGARRRLHVRNRRRRDSRLCGTGYGRHQHLFGGHRTAASRSNITAVGLRSAISPSFG